jgi:glycosidase
MMGLGLVIRTFLVALMLPYLAQAAEARPCDGATADNNVIWDGLKHDSFQEEFRQPFGAVSDRVGRVRIRFQTCAQDVSSLRIRVWDDGRDRELWYEMYADQIRTDPKLGTVTLWVADLPIGQSPTILYYIFEIRDGFDVDYYTDDEPKFFGGGLGNPSSSFDVLKSYQLTVYSHDFVVPDWFKGAVVYQIFPDRFRNGERRNDPVDGGDWIYGMHARKYEWHQEMCDPRSDECRDEFSNQFYGGDLKGVTSKIDYLASLGVNVIYLNPIVMAPSNHRYDTQDYYRVDPYLGDLQDFRELSARAAAKGIRVIGDGVFNHTSADHPFFDLYSRWGEREPSKTSRGPGTNDRSGACESSSSPYRTWFYLPDVGSPAKGDDGRNLVLCPRTLGDQGRQSRSTYEAWYGFYSLPKLDTTSAGVRGYFFERDDQSVAPFWIAEGAAGWRLDVATDIDAGATLDPKNQFWEGFRSAIKRVDSEAVMIAEEWGDASAMLLGNEMDTAMNYRFRSALFNWLFDGCVGTGCRGTEFHDNDNNPESSSGVFRRYDEREFWLALEAVREDYPPQSFLSAWNLVGSHDTQRAQFVLKKISSDRQDIAARKHRLMMAFQFLYPGSATIYYGDEVGLACSGKLSNGRWEDDPYNRCVYPWSDLGLSGDDQLLAQYRQMAALRQNHPALRYGDVRLVDANPEARTLSFVRNYQGVELLVVINRLDRQQDVVIDIDSLHLKKSAVLRDLVNSQKSYVPRQGQLKLEKLAGYSWQVLRVGSKP